MAADFPTDQDESTGTSKRAAPSSPARTGRTGRRRVTKGAIAAAGAVTAYVVPAATRVARGQTVGSPPPVVATPTTPPQSATPTAGPPGQLKICKVLAQGTTAPAGTLFSFTVTGVSGTFDVAPGTCVLAGSFPPGQVTVTETAPAGYAVTAIGFKAGTGGAPDLANKRIAVTIVSNQVTEVEFTNASTVAAT